MPNLRGASPVGRDDGDVSYAARSISSGKLNWRRRGRGERTGRYTKLGGGRCVSRVATKCRR